MMNFEEMIREMEALQKKMIESAFGDVEGKEFEIDEDNLEGGWEIEPIDKPGVKGFMARGFFKTHEPLERPKDILPPLKPKIRDPREALYDITSDEDKLLIYIEMPGVEEGEIQLNATPGRLDVSARDFKTEIDLSNWVLDIKNISTEYRNGVLKVIIPKAKLDEQLI